MRLRPQGSAASPSSNTTGVFADDLGVSAPVIGGMTPGGAGTGVAGGAALGGASKTAPFPPTFHSMGGSSHGVGVRAQAGSMNFTSASGQAPTGSTVDLDTRSRDGKVKKGGFRDWKRR